MALNFAEGWLVRVLLSDGEIEVGTVEIKCGNKDQGDWFVVLDDGRQVCVREYQMERITR